MNSKNILIAIGVLGIGAILYKVLLGFVLPIALLVSLIYVLRFLLKGSDSDSSQEVSKVLTNSDSSSSVENIVEIKAIKKAKPLQEAKPVGEAKPFQEAKPVEEVKPVEETKATKEAKPNEENKPNE